MGTSRSRATAATCGWPATAIYNHRRLSAELGEESFRTGSDHEAALRLFERDGIDGVDRLWGTFAFVIAGEDGRFAAVRDELGVAPLYWARRDGTVLFASELKAFEEEWQAEIEPFPTGHVWTPEGGLRKWASAPVGLSMLLRNRAPDEEPPLWVLDAIRDAVVRAVEEALIGDVPIGAFLSGGLDSSIICAIAVRACRERGAHSERSPPGWPTARTSSPPARWPSTSGATTRKRSSRARRPSSWCRR